MTSNEAKEDEKLSEKFKVTHDGYLKIATKKTELLLNGEYGIKVQL